MNEQMALRQHQPGFYQIQVSGRISPRRFIWFEDLLVTAGDEDVDRPITTLTGKLVDQAALLGALHKLYTLGFTLLSVRRIDVPDLIEVVSDR